METAVVEPIVKAIVSQAGLAVLILLLMCCFLAWMLIAFRKQDREDRQAERQAHIDALDRNTASMERMVSTMTELRVVVAQQGARNAQDR